MSLERSREELLNAWRSLWLSWCLAFNPKAKKVVGLSMSRLYEDVPKLFTLSEWNEFVETLPGYMDYYQEVKQRILAGHRR